MSTTAYARIRVPMDDALSRFSQWIGLPELQLIVVQAGSVVREFLDDEQDPGQNVNRGRLPFEKTSPINDWINAAWFMDEDEIAQSPDEGLLWMFGPAT
jgi:hypothetical protein